jgi:membrane protease YdiL (CAAX protease family)
MAIIVVLFAIAALGGAVLAYSRLRDRPLSVPVAVLHGLFAVAGFAALLVAAVSATTTDPPWAAIGLFAVAAAGGVVLASFHVRGRALPVPLMFVHAGVAVAGFLALLVAVLA